MPHDHERNRRSWNAATRLHNAHKGDQAAALRAGQELLFPEELELLGDLAGRRLVHLQCNAGQDSLCLARRGARVTGVDLSDEAIAFARQLSAAAALPAEFVEAEVVEWLHRTSERFDVAFASYGATTWLPDLDAWARGVARVLVPGGRLVYVEFHPLTWSVGPSGRLEGDDYFASAAFEEPVRDYVALSGPALGARQDAVEGQNPEPALAYQHGLGRVVTALLEAGLALQTLREYPHANGCRTHPLLELASERRWVWPPGVARLPLMFGLAAVRP